MRRERDEDGLVSRWSVLAAALFLTAIFGLLSGVVRDVQFPRGVQAADSGSETPKLTKREPLRALAAADRKDSTGTHAAHGGGALVPHFTEIEFPLLSSTVAPALSAARPALTFWPASLPRAPPQQA
ncbi:hypothetical protein KX729_24545 [Rhizobium sp. XQZ8]|uniref:hypothetical protein n=1 Tax=Rhizobium populisoli TaxID=2859785 RepID=UPI001CA5CDB3|nr:hypothetical protein [Rhizobium populisoli]MBW6424625.1 hypothetical protein [Rhizobium populisoli]